jgi:hypothetical protein
MVDPFGLEGGCPPGQHPDKSKDGLCVGPSHNPLVDGNTGGPGGPPAPAPGPPDVKEPKKPKKPKKPRNQALIDCMGAANKQFMKTGATPPSVGEVLGLGNADAIVTQASVAGILKLLGMDFAGGFAITGAVSSVYYLGKGAVQSATAFVGDNKAYNDAAAACHAKFGN